MKAIIQRVTRASVTIDGALTASIGDGLLVLLGVMEGDDEEALRLIAAKLPKLRIFSDGEGKMNRSVADIGGSILLVSNFTLGANCRKGNRPDFFGAAKPEIAEPLYEKCAALLRAELGEDRVATGVFGADMKLDLLNDGPVTIILDSAELAGVRR